MDDRFWNRTEPPAPFFYLGRFPIHVTGLIILAHVVAIVIHALTGNQLQLQLLFDPARVFESGKIWLYITHPFSEFPTINWALGLWFFWYYGSKVEEVLGRRNFGRLFFAWIVGPAVIMSLIYWAGRLSSYEDRVMGFAPLLWTDSFLGKETSFTAIFTFLVFVRMFPNAPFIVFGFPVKWLGLIGALLQILQYVMFRAWWHVGIFFAFLFITRALLGRLAMLPDLNLWNELTWGNKVVDFPRQPKEPSRERARSVERDTAKRPAAQAKSQAGAGALPYQAKLKYVSPAVVPNSDMATVDDILEKISREGVGSLTASERAILESASQKLAQRDHKDGRPK